MNHNQISVALATRNGRKYIEEQLESILNQTVKPYEIIVCDDASTDETISILSNYENKGLIKLFINKTPLGVIQNFQQAINRCSGRYIALSDQDDVWKPAKLQMSLEKMKEIEVPGLPCLVYSDLEVVDEKLVIIQKSFWKYLSVHPHDENFYSILYGNVITGCTILMNTNFKRYIETIPGNALMHDQWCGLVAYGLGKVGVINESTVKYRRHEYNTTVVKKINFMGRAFRALSNTFTEFRNGSTLKGELLQAKTFHEIFKTSLPERRLEDLKKFLTLERQGFLTRKMKKFLIKRFTRHFSDKG